MESEIPRNTDEPNDHYGANTGETQSRKENFYQIIACIIANTSVLGPAMGFGYSAVALDPLTSSDSDVRVTEEEGSWIVSVMAIATPIGCVLSSIAMRRGRRFAIMTTSVISVTGWLVIYFSPDVNYILTGRAICGIAAGLASVPATVYAAEVTDPKLRGNVVTWTSVTIAIGILCVYTLGFIFQKNWRLIALLSGLFPVISMILVAIKMPESPLWLRISGRVVEAEKALRDLNGIKSGEATPSDLLIKISRYDGSQEPENFRVRNTLFSSANFKPLFVMLGFFFFQQFSGTFVVIYYAVQFTREAGVKIDGYLAAILIGVARLFGTLCVSYVSRKYGRRIPSIASGTGMTLFMGILSVYSWVTSKGYRVNDRGLIPVISIIMYILTSTMGFLVLPFAMIGEIYPARVKDVFSGITTCLAYVFSFFVLKIYPNMLRAFDKHGIFLFYAIFSLIGTIFVTLFLPETKGKTLQDIEDLFVNRKIKETEKTVNTEL